MKALKITAAVIAAFVIAGALALALGIPAGFLVKPINSRLEAATGYRLRVAGEARLTFWPALTLRAHDVSVGRDGDAADRFAAQSVEVSLSLASLLARNPEITEIAVTRPIVRVPLLRERLPAPPRADATVRDSPEHSAARLTVQRLTVVAGVIVLAGQKDGREESRIDQIDLTASLAGSEDSIDARARWDETAVHLVVKGARLADGVTGESVPIDFVFDAPDLVQTLSGAANIRTRGSQLAVNGLTGSLGPDRFNGWANVDFSSKPFVTLDLNIKHLAVPLGRAAPPSGISTGAGVNAPPRGDQPAGWSEQAVNLNGLNFFDADVQFSASELLINTFRLAPISLRAQLQRGVLQATLTATGLYDGRVEGTIGLDASGPIPGSSMRVNVNEVRAQPLLADLADFRKLDGRLRAAVDVRATGASQRAAIASLEGSVEFGIQDGQIRGINVARMVRALTRTALTGWQETPTESTDFTELRARFRLANGRATTEDLALASPLVRVSGVGSADLLNGTLAFKLDPKLVLSLQGQGGPADPAGLGVPVLVEGSWSDPHIYPDIAGILENPDAAYARLRALGQGLFGRERDGGGIDSLLQGLGSLLNAPRSERRDDRRPPPDTRQSETPTSQDPAREFLRNFLGR